jgi:hypothetical protein
VGGHVGDARLGGGECVATGGRRSAGSRSGGKQLLAGALGEDWCPRVVGEVKPLA